MEKMLAVVFDTQSKAFDGFESLRMLDLKGEIFIHEAQIIEREPNGAVRVIDKPVTSSFSKSAAGTLVGALVGILGGPVGALVGAGAGALIGWIGDAKEAGLSDEFADEIARALTPGKVAVVGEIVEERVTPVDTQMERVGGVVFRRTLKQVKTTQDDRDAAAHTAEIEQLQAERAEASADRLAKIDAKIDSLRTKLENAIEHKRAKMQLRQQQRESKIRILQTKADQAEGEIRRRQQARIAELRRDYAEKTLGETSDIVTHNATP
jgi:uncharacterized membrane protein